MSGSRNPELGHPFQTKPFDLPAALLLSALVFVAAHGAFLFDPYVANDDVRQQLFWMLSWLDSQLYGPEYVLADFSAQYVSWGVRGLYRIAAFLGLDPILAGKLLTGVLYTFMGGAVFGLSRRIAGGGNTGRWVGFASLAVFLLHPYFLHNISGGLARAFAGPLLVGFAWAWAADRGRRALVCLLLQALFIPYIFVLCAGSLALAWSWERVRPSARALPADASTVSIAAAFAMGGAVTFAFNRALTAAGFGPLVDKADMIGNVIFTSKGRLEIFPTPSVLKLAVLDPLEKLMPFQEWGPALGAAGAVVLGAFLLGTAIRAPWRETASRSRALFAIAASSLVLYAVARLVLLKLFLPERYIEYSAHVIWCLLLGLPLGYALSRLGAPDVRRALGIGVLVAVTVLAGVRLQGQGLYHYEDHASLYEAVRQTDKQAVIGGHPSLMDNVLTFGQRRVYVTFEIAQPWCVGLWNIVEPRLEKTFRAYYSDSAEDVDRWCRAEGIDYIVVDDRHFEPWFLKPEKQYIPLKEALRLPGWASWLAEPIAALARAFGVPETAVKPHERTDTYRDGVPFFAPFDELIADVVEQGGGRFALLDETRFPGTRIGPHQRIIDMRSAVGEAGGTKEAS
ncbi:hypothetical protein DPQ33_09020 [Oceanidesulfovibrio indonesiensis]|uniref:Glycosyltransferase RgtA/B/C/D-like domain-containing protein n=1 Tax=Oceanidesulfovibrio indonesiensis TaxID=54767 RepID=A0A7M3MFB3_9BACT|nr:hypothetical protein [Oceanidesulfovibrio indonesiensis]TVM17317.1 hypothetical protein DPQ33_09020 [Oceanidesulfovibrio indonesiensis]